MKPFCVSTLKNSHLVFGATSWLFFSNHVLYNLCTFVLRWQNTPLCVHVCVSCVHITIVCLLKTLTKKPKCFAANLLVACFNRSIIPIDKTRIQRRRSQPSGKMLKLPSLIEPLPLMLLKLLCWEPSKILRANVHKCYKSKHLPHHHTSSFWITQLKIEWPETGLHWSYVIFFLSFCLLLSEVLANLKAEINKSKEMKVAAVRPLILAAEENLHNMMVDLDKVVTKVRRILS